MANANFISHDLRITNFNTYIIMKYIVSIVGILSSLAMFFLWGFHFAGTYMVFFMFLWCIPAVLFWDLLLSTPKGQKYLNKWINWLKS